MTDARRPSIGVSLKMYHRHSAALEWLRNVRLLAENHPAVLLDEVELFVLPSYPSLVPAMQILRGTNVRTGAQDVSWADEGAFTGEVSGVELAEIGCTFVELGHAERRNLLGETDIMIAAKTLAAVRNGLAPVLCVGEQSMTSPLDAARECVRQLNAYLQGTREAGIVGRIVVAYEPQWAIGATEPANPDYVRTVVNALRASIATEAAFAGSSFIYGGSAGPGLLGSLGGAVDGLFLGRSAHSMSALNAVLDEAQEIARTRKGPMG